MLFSLKTVVVMILASVVALLSQPLAGLARELLPGLYTRTLGNGLNAVVKESHRAPVVAVQVWVKAGSAYVCDLNAEQTREYRGTLTTPGKDSPYRTRSIEENLDLFEKMKAGDHGKLTIGILIYPNMSVTPPTYEGLPNGFPQGDGLLATIHFNLTEQKEYPWAAETPINIKPLFGNAFIDSDGDWIPFDPANFVNTSVKVYGYVLGRQIDLYTEYYYKWLYVDEEFAKKLRKYYNLLEIHHFVKEVYNLLYRKYASELEVGDTEAWYMAKVFDTYGIKATTIKVVYSMLNLVIVKEEFGDKVIYKVFKEGRVGYYKSLPVDY